MIENLRLESCHDSPYLKPKRLHYTEDGVQKSWDILETHDSVSVLLYHTQRRAFVLVKQFRPAVFLKGGEGYTYELCAGIVDKEGKSLAEIASEEVLEECGFSLSPDSLVRLSSFYTSVGFAGARQSLFYAEVSEENRISEGGGIEREKIEVIYLPLEEARAFMQEESKPKTPGLLYALLWFLERHEAPQI